MRIRMKSLAAGPNFIYYPGQEVDVADNVALAWIRQGSAEAVGKEAETATVEPSEQATTPKRRRRKSAKRG